MVSGCAVEPIQLPDFDVAARSDIEVTDATEYPELCEIPFETAECYQRLDVYEDVAENNKDLANLNASIARDNEKAYDLILSAGKKQQQIGVIREDMLQAERNDHTFDNIWHRSLIVVLAIGLML